MSSNALLLIEETRAKELARCERSIKCPRLKSREQTSQGDPDITGAIRGTDKVRRYSNDNKEEQNTTSSNARHGATTQGMTFKTPRKEVEERNIGRQPKNKMTAKGKAKEIEIQEQTTTSSNARYGATTQGMTFKTPRKELEEGNIEVQPKNKMAAKGKAKEIEIHTKHENGTQPKRKRSRGNDIEDERKDERKEKNQ